MCRRLIVHVPGIHDWPKQAERRYATDGNAMLGYVRTTREWKPVVFFKAFFLHGEALLMRCNAGLRTPESGILVFFVAALSLLICF